MGLRKEKKSNIALFFLSYAGFSVLTGAVLSALFGAAAVDLLKSMVPGDDSPFWAILEFAVSVFILVWVLRKIFRVGKKKEKAGKKAVGLNLLEKLVAFVDKVKEKRLKSITRILYAVFVIIAIALLVDTGFYLFCGRYLF